MATVLYSLVALSTLVHTVLFLSLNLYIHFRSQSLSREYTQESETLDLLTENCGIGADPWDLENELKEFLKASPLKEEVFGRKRQLSPLQMMMADLLKAQELVLEQHCINNTRLCVYGAKGDNGLPGLKGVSGEKGDPGPQPQRGFPGRTGSKGDPGLPGQKGDPGARGDAGELGEKGDVGSQGSKGDLGAVGDKGVRGDSGVVGVKGEIGTSGLTGDQGGVGEAGVKGQIGSKGTKGVPGDKGDVGPNGLPGKGLDAKCLCKAPKQKSHLIETSITNRVMMACPTGNGTVLNVTWSKDGSSVLPIRMLQEGNDLILPEVYPGDVGVYKCTARVVDASGSTVTVQDTFEIRVTLGIDRHNCDFERDLCTWTQSKGDNFDLNRHQGSTLTAMTGPASDHTIGGSPGGYYLYLESSDNQNGDKAVLVSSEFTNSLPICLTFWYHMYGRDTASLEVVLEKQSNSTIWSKSGNQGDEWQRAVVEIPGSRSPYKVLLEVTQGASYHGDIAVDDIVVLDGPCTKFNKTPQ
ncbi:uncharacterized protein LOC111117446 [Crassostrea virginica]